MDKILAFSILSSSPADLSSGVGFSTRLSWRTSSARTQQPAPAPSKKDKAGEQQQQQQGSGSSSRPAGSKQESQPRPRFAPEFDGINCFESIVSF